MFSTRTEWRLVPNELTRLCEERKRARLPVLDLTESNPTRCGFDYDETKILDAFHDPHILNYEPDPRGLDSARQAVLEYYQARGVRLDASQIFLTASTSEAYSFIFRLTADTGDQLLAPQPSYPLFEFLTQLNDLELARYPLIEEDRWRIDSNTLERRICGRARAILVVHPNNPTGSFVHQQEREFLIDCCAERRVALIADEVFYDYDHEIGDSDKSRTFAGETGALVFTLSGLSKVSALPQMKCAWIVLSGPDNLVKEASARLEVITDTYLSTSTPVARALPALLSMRQELQAQIMARIRANLACLDRLIGTGARVRRFTVEGGWYAVLWLPTWRSDEAWSIRLLEEDGVLIHPGHFYDFQGDSHVVVSLICLPETFEAGIARLIDRLESDSDLAQHPAL
jgi:alanine-synthesizing transaminase